MPLWIVLGVALVAILLGAALVGSYIQTRGLLTPRRTPLNPQPADVGLAAEDVTFASPRGRLAAWYVPSRNGCTLICCHGIHSNRSQWVAQMAQLHERSGYGALLFDFAGHGTSASSLVTYGVRESEDVAAALAYLRARGDVAMDRIGILGYSLGAITAVLATAEQPELRCMVIESGFADVQHDLRLLFTRYTGLPPFPFADLVVFWGQRIANVRLAEIRPVRAIDRISPRAVFIISDLRDELANEPSDGERLYAAAREPKYLWQVPEAGHVAAFNTAPAEWVQRVGDFLDTHLAGQTPMQAAQSSASANVPQTSDTRDERE